MPNIKSAKKRVLVSQTKAMQNKAAKSALKTDIKKFEAAVAEGNRSEADVGKSLRGAKTTSLYLNPRGLRIVDDRLQINVAGSTWDVSSCPGIQPGDYVIVPAQRLIDPLENVGRHSPGKPAAEAEHDGGHDAGAGEGEHGHPDHLPARGAEAERGLLVELRGLGEDLGAVLVAELDVAQKLVRVLHDGLRAVHGQLAPGRIGDGTAADSQSLHRNSLQIWRGNSQSL